MENVSQITQSAARSRGGKRERKVRKKVEAGGLTLTPEVADMVGGINM